MTMPADTLPQTRTVRVLSAMERYALYTMVFSLPLQGLAIVPGTTFTVTKVLGGLIVLLCVVRRILGREFPFVRTGIESGVALFALAALASLPHSIAPASSWAAASTLAQYLLLFYAVADIARNAAVHACVPGLYILAAAISGLGAVDAYFLGHIPATADTVVQHSHIRRIAVGMQDPNHQALLFLFAVAFLLFQERVWRRWPSFVLSAFALSSVLAGLVLTMSRASWGVFVVLVLARIAVAKRRMAWLVATGVVVLCGGLVCALMLPGVVDTAKRRALELGRGGDASAASRIWHYASVMERAEKSGPFGHGLDTAHIAIASLEDPLGERPAVTVHNAPLLLWLETGWFGLICYGWLWSCIWAALITAWLETRDNPTKRDTLRPYFAVLSTYAAVSLVMPFVYYSGFPVLLGCLIGATRAAPAARRAIASSME